MITARFGLGEKKHGLDAREPALSFGQFDRMLAGWTRNERPPPTDRLRGRTMARPAVPFWREIIAGSMDFSARF